MRKILFVAVLAAAPMVVRGALAQQQVSDTDRAAARELFFDGKKLQEEGKFAEALDRFSRAQRIFSAPTHLLHIAECQVAIGQLVEGAETYRTLVRTPLPQGSPAAFTQAQQQGGAELAQVEPRIPQVKIDVTPANAANLQVQVDGAPMNTALVGISRPIDPGAHKVVVFAPGYGRQEAQFALKERESKTVPLTLQPTGGVVYGPPVVVPPPVVGPQPVPVTQPEPGTQPGTQPPPPDQAWETQRRVSTSSLLGGVRLGAMFPAGLVAHGNGTTGATDLNASDVATPGLGLGFEGGLRFARRFFLGLGFEHGVYGKGDKAATGTGTTSTTVSSNLIDARFAYISNPDGVGFYGEAGIGYRWLIDTNESGTTLTSVTGTQTESAVFRGAELELGAGMFIRAGNYLRFIPKVSFGIGSFTKYDYSCTGTCRVANTTLDVPNTGMHTFIFLGLGGYYNYDLNRN